MRAKAADAAHEEQPHPAPVPRDPDLPTVSNTTLAFFAAASMSREPICASLPPTFAFAA